MLKCLHLNSFKLILVYIMCCLNSHFQLNCSCDVIDITLKRGGDVIYGSLMCLRIYCGLYGSASYTCGETHGEPLKNQLSIYEASLALLYMVSDVKTKKTKTKSCQSSLLRQTFHLISQENGRSGSNVL